MIFQRERIADFLQEALPLFKTHSAEVDWNPEKVPFDPDTAAYLMMDAKDVLIAFTGRDGGELKAYAIFFFHASPHHKSTKWAVNDFIYVDPEFRGMTGIRFMNYIEGELVNLGVQVISYSVKKDHDWGKVLSRQGFKDDETVWLKWVGE